jgi:uncharacterized membrane protein YfhO
MRTLKFNRPIVGYTLLFLFSVIIIFLPYVITGTSLIWHSDGIAQHYPALMSWRETLRSFFFDHQLPEMWHWQIGLGADYLQTFSYYTIGDFFTYPVIFVPKTSVVTYYGVMIIIRLYLAGLSFILAAKYFMPNAKGWTISAAALGYTFFGYTAFAAFEHPFFINPLIIWPLLITAGHHLLTTKKWLPFTIMVFWALFNNFYFGFMLGLGTIICWLIFTFTNRGFLNWRTFGRTVWAGLLGLGGSAILLIPSLIAQFSSTRTGSSLANGLLLYPANYYIGLPGNLIGNYETPIFWLTGGFLSINVMAIWFTWRRFKRYKILAVTWMLATIFLLSPIFAAIFNGGTSPSNRWTFMLALPVGLATVLLLNHLDDLDKRDWSAFLIIGLGSSFSLFVGDDFNLNTGYGLLIAFYGLTMLLLLMRRFAFRRATFALVAVITGNAILVMNHNHQNNLNPNTTLMVSNENIATQTTSQPAYQQWSDTSAALNRVFIDDQLNNVNEKGHTRNMPLLSGLSNVESYWSLQNGAVGKLMNQLQLSSSNSNPNDVVGNLDYRNALLNILGVKTIFSNETNRLTPASYKESTAVIETKQHALSSKSAYPLFYVTPAQTTVAQFNKLSGSDREALLVDTTVTSTTSGKPSFINTLIKPKVAFNQEVKFGKSAHVSTTTHASLIADGIFIQPDPALSGTEVHLEITNLTYKPFSFNERMDAAVAAYRFKHEQIVQNPSDTQDPYYNATAFKWNWLKDNLTSVGPQISNYTLTAKYGSQNVSFTQTGQNNLSFFNPRDNITLNLGRAINSDSPTFVPLTFDKMGKYEFDVHIVGVPTDARFINVADSVRVAAPKYKLGKNTVTIDVSKFSGELITSTMPYSTGWRSSDAKITKVNSGFIGIQVPKNAKTVTLTYQTPGLLPSLIVTIISFFITIGLFFITRKSLSNQ